MAVNDDLKLAACPHRPACPGCPRFGLPGLASETVQSLRALATLGGLPDPLQHLQQGRSLGFRYRARLAVRGRAKNPKLGIFETGTHHVVHIPECPIHHPAINGAARTIRHALVEHQLAPYADAAHAGSVRYVQIVIERRTGLAHVVVVTRDDDAARMRPFFHTLELRMGADLGGLFWNLQPERSNTILGREFRHISGAAMLREDFAGASLFFPPGAFGQSHLDLAEQIALHVRELCPSGARVAEFYGGVGALGLPLAHKAQRLRCNEIAEASLEGLVFGIAALPEALRSRVQVYPGSAGSAVEMLADSDLAIVDPPRKGLDRALLEALLEKPPERLIYVSCGLPALAREAQELLGSGRWALREIRPYALFPYTEHVETLAVFERRAPGPPA